jgi:hypothetical protein
MKKIITISALLISSIAFSQSSISLKIKDTPITILTGNTVYTTTIVEDLTEVVFDITNRSSTNKRYKTKRYDLIVNTVNGTPANPRFCFAGNCYLGSTMLSIDTLKLIPGQSSTQVPGSYQNLSCDIDETSAKGITTVKYTVFNIDMLSDSLQFTIKYNDPNPTYTTFTTSSTASGTLTIINMSNSTSTIVTTTSTTPTSTISSIATTTNSTTTIFSSTITGVGTTTSSTTLYTSLNETSLKVNSFSVFPNPTKDITTLKINANNSFKGIVKIYNALGASVLEKSVEITDGKNAIELPISSLDTGIYFISLEGGNNLITRKLIIQ